MTEQKAKTRQCPRCGGENSCEIIPGLPLVGCPSYFFEMRELERRAYLSRLAKARTAREVRS
jgi:hypothetical protein